MIPSYFKIEILAQRPLRRVLGLKGLKSFLNIKRDKTILFTPCGTHHRTAHIQCRATTLQNVLKFYNLLI